MTPSYASTSLPLLLLPHPHTLFPSSRLTFPVSRTAAQSILSLLDHVPPASESPLVAAVPTLSNNDGTTGSQWGCAARVLRIVRPPLALLAASGGAGGGGGGYFVTLHGVARIRRVSGDVHPGSSTSSSDASSSAATGTASHALVEYFTDDSDSDSDAAVDPETLDRFKRASVMLLERLGVTTTMTARRDGGYAAKIATLIEELPGEKAGWMADVLVANVRADFDDKLALLSTTSVPQRLELATALFNKLCSQLTIPAAPMSVSRVLTDDEAKMRLQRENYLRHQLNVIQKELSMLSNGNSSSSPLISRGSKSTTSTSASHSELDDDEASEADDLAELKRGIERMRKGSEERKMAVREWKRMKRIPQGSAEGGVVRGYLEWLTSLPWPTDANVPVASATDRAFLSRAREQLDNDHFGLEKVKKRLIEYLAVVRLRELAAKEHQKISPSSTTEHQVSPSSSPPGTTSRKRVKGPILLFVGPPGTGKTSLGQSIAKALNRPFQRISLGGVRDEAEIRGHRRTYVASGPGLIVQALRKAGRSDLVVLLDEIDKVGQSNFHGDPAAALLEVLDPEQNHSFNDHYINIPIDLSQVLFICTANTLETISAPLLDRCEVVTLSGYTYDEKMHIARRFLLPKQLSINGLEEGHVEITDEAMKVIATMYTREAGVRSLDRAIGGVVRAKTVEWAECVDDARELVKDGEEIISATTTTTTTTAGAPMYNRVVDVQDVEPILGIPRWDGEEREREEKRGLVYGLVVSGYGEGGILPVETMCVPGTGRIMLTGSLGDVIKESAELALSWFKTHAFDLCVTNSRAHDPLKVPHPMDVHLHLPAGATKKDGPSAGVAMVCALVSLMTGVVVPNNVAMTGEITLRGRVTPVGGIKEKVLGAHRAQITKVILPYANKKDVEQDVAKEIRLEMEFVFVRTVREALEAAFGGSHKLAWRSDAVLLESRL